MSSSDAGDGKRSWRASEGTPPGSGGGSSKGGSAPSGKPKRFLGGSAGGRSNQNSPAWFRLFVPIVALSVIVVGIGVLVWMLRLGATRPLLVAWAVTDYESPDIPLNQFAYRDVQKILRSTSFSVGNSQDSRDKVAANNLQTPRGFNNFFDATLSKIQDDTIVIYISAHGVSRSDSSFLLHSDSTSDPGSGYPIRKILEKTANCSARRKLLILDSTRIPSSLAMGLLGNDFVENVKKDFGEVTKNLPERDSFWVLLSSDAGQESWVSRSVGHSIFGITVAYALRGGIAIDTPDDRGRTDGYLSVNEMTNFVQTRVASWSPRFRDGAIQRPLCLKHGPDFKLIRADDRLTEKQFLEEASAEQIKAEEKAAAAKKEEEKKPADAGAAASKETAKPEETKSEAAEAGPAVAEPWANSMKALVEAVKPVNAALAAPPGDPSAVLTDAQWLDAIMAFWTFRDELTAKPDFLRKRPHELHAFVQSILRAERFFLARQTADVGRMMDKELLREARSLVRPFTITDTKPNWSTAFADPALKEDPLAAFATTIGTLRDDAAEKNRESVAKLPVAEARLLSMLAQEFTQGDKWIDADVVALSLQVRSTAERSTKLPDARLLPLLKAELMAADQSRREGERDLLLRRLVAAKQKLQEANAKYENVERQAKQLDASLRKIEQTVGNTIYYVRWLGDDLANRDARSEDVNLLEKVLADLKEIDLADSNAIAQIDALANQCQRLEGKALDYAERSWQRTSWRQTRAALELVFLPADRRKKMLEWMLTDREDTPFKYDSRAKAADATLGPANLYPLVGLTSLLGSSDELKADLIKLGPVSGSELSTETMLQEPAARALRASTGEHVREILLQAAAAPIASATDDTSPPKVWASEMRCRLLAPLRALAGSEASADDAFFEQLDRRYQNSWLRWEVERLLADDSNLPKTWYRPTVNLAVEAFRKVEPTYREAIPLRQVKLNGSEELSVPATGKLLQTLSLDIPRDAKSGVRSLVFDWFSDIDRLVVSSGKVKGSDGRLVLDVPADIGEKPWLVPLEIDRIGNDYSPPRFRAWIERVDGSVEWLNLSLKFATPEVKPAELIFSWAERGGESDIVEMYPNQQIPLVIKLKKNSPAPLPLRLEISSGDALPIKILVPLPEAALGEHPVPLNDPLAELNLGGDEDGFALTVRLFKESTLLDERKLRINVLDVQRVFAVDVAIDRDQAEGVFRVRRIETADSTVAVPLALSLGDDGGEPNAVAKIEDGASEGILRCPLPTEGRKPIIANLAVAGVPRAFRYAISLDPPVARLITKPSLSIASPPNNSVFQFDSKRQSLPVKLYVDGIVAENLRDSQLRVGVVSQRETALGPQNAVMNVMGRSLAVKLVLAKDAKDAPIYLDNHMGDVAIDMEAPWKMGRQTIRAELAVGSQVNSANSNVYFLRDAPPIRLDQPAEGTKITLGKPIRATIAPADDNGEVIDSVEFFLDKNGNGKRDDDTEAVIPLGAAADGVVRFDATNKPVVVDLPTDGLKAGNVFIICRPRIRFVLEPPATEPVVRFGKEIRRQVVITEPKPAAEEMKPQFGTITGVAKIGSQPAPRAMVKIMGVGESAVDASGQFRFEKVPPGKYTVVATVTQPLLREGQAMIEVVAGKEVNVEVEMRIKQSPPTP